MEIPKLIILLCYTYYSLASEHTHTIPVEDYETELQVLGQHVEIPETPVKVIKITKTIAVKVPVPYPVKVIEKVPYPVHVSKPYPVPVPQIIHVPQATSKAHHDHEGDAGHGTFKPHQLGGQEGHAYQVQETPSYESQSNGGHSFHPLSESQSYDGNSGHGLNFGASDDDHSDGGSYDGPNSYHGYSSDNDGNGSFESKSYDEAIKNYLNKRNPSGNSGNSGYHFH